MVYKWQALMSRDCKRSRYMAGPSLQTPAKNGQNYKHAGSQLCCYSGNKSVTRIVMWEISLFFILLPFHVLCAVFLSKHIEDCRWCITLRYLVVPDQRLLTPSGSDILSNQVPSHCQRNQMRISIQPAIEMGGKALLPAFLDCCSEWVVTRIYETWHLLCIFLVA